MGVFTELLHKLKPKNWQQGNHFFLLESQYVEFAYDPTVRYYYGSIVTYNGKFYQRNQVTAGYNPGIAPTNSNYWIAANPGRDLGDYPTLADLQTAHPSPGAGSIATVEEDDAFYKWDNDAQEWKAISGNGGRDLGHFATLIDLYTEHPTAENGNIATTDEPSMMWRWLGDTLQWQPLSGRDKGHYSDLDNLISFFPTADDGSIATVDDENIFYRYDAGTAQWIPMAASGVIDLPLVFNSDLDTVSAPIPIYGKISDIVIHKPYEISSYTFEAKTNGGSYTYLNSISALNTWIDTNVAYDYTLWFLKVEVVYGVGNEGQASVLMQYKKVKA